MGSFYPQRVAPEELLEQVGLADKSGSRVKQLSLGQKQRFTVAASLVNDPELVILDEPTTGLDPQARHSLWDLIRQIHQRNATVVLTTHYMEEAETLCQRLAIMDHGKIVAIDTPNNLIGRIKTTYTIKLIASSPLTKAQSLALGGLAEPAPVGQALESTQPTQLTQSAHSTNSIQSDPGYPVHAVRRTSLPAPVGQDPGGAERRPERHCPERHLPQASGNRAGHFGGCLSGANRQ